MDGGRQEMPPTLQMLVGLLDDALDGFGADARPRGATPAAEPVALLEQCLQLCRTAAAADAAPIRTLHHLSCTGGTLIAKCLAAMPNVVVFNEIDPLSTLKSQSGKPQFAPSDLILLARQAYPILSETLLAQIFLQGLTLLREEFDAIGMRILLRDHSHSHFLTGDDIPDRPSLLAMLNGRFPTASIVTVRDPVDSFLSLQHNKWLNFKPATFDEYCRRYLAFLDAHANIAIFRYEDFVQSPNQVLMAMCEILALNYVDSFIETFDAIRLSGDSGRKGAVIEPRQRRPLADALIQAAENSTHYKTLAERLGYADIAVNACRNAENEKSFNTAVLL